jgi:DNA-damage-inducible protein J
MTTIQISTRVDDQIKEMGSKSFRNCKVWIFQLLSKMLLLKQLTNKKYHYLKNSETTTPYPSDWFNDERISNRKRLLIWLSKILKFKN